VSFIGPHPPLAPPIPFNRMYNPDPMSEPVLGRIEEDHLDEEIPFMRYAIWADAINTALTKIVKARYYGEVTYSDYCLGRILDAIEARPNSQNVLICFFPIMAISSVIIMAGRNKTSLRPPAAFRCC
jgi:arylsulfatase